MNERFWAPTRPTITPDAVAVALLTPHGGDRAGDLGASLLGMHRAGAAACEFVAKGAVPSEHRLLEVLATCRESMGGPAADAVSKSMEARYAGLLVRDLLDDAETAAAGLYRACVTKGVAPPLAASRVGAVYGVPSSELGRYRALATDPRVNPLALTDAADRTLLGYVAKVVADEVGEVSEEVSKAVQDRGRSRHSHVVDETDAGWDAREHPRSTTTGQFVRGAPSGAKPVKEEQPELRVPTAAERLRARLGLGAESAPTVVVTPEPVATPVETPVKPPARKQPQRVQRQQRQKRKAIRPQVQPGGMKADAGMKADTGMKASAGMTANAHLLTHANWVYAAGDLKRTNEMRAKLGMVPTIEQQKEAAKDLVIPHGRTKNRPDDMMDLPIPTGTHGEYGEVYAPLAFVLGQGEGLDFRIHAHGTGLSEDPRRFRAGWLVEAAGQPETTEERTDGKRTEADKRLDFMAQIAKVRARDGGADDPVVVNLNPKLMGSHDWEREAYIRGLQTELAAGSKMVELETGSDDERDEAIEEESANIELMTELGTGREVLVHWQPAVEDDGEIRHPYRRPQPIVEMFVMQGESFSGRMEGTGASVHDQYLIDPNQALTISEDFVPYWDSQRQVVIHVYQLRPIDEAQVKDYDEGKGFTGFFGKAVQDRGRLRGREAIEFEQEHPRDTTGRFSTKNEAASGVAPTAIPTPVERLRAKLGLEEVDVQPAQPVQQPQRRKQRPRRQQRQKRKPLSVQTAPRVAPSGLTSRSGMISTSSQVKAQQQITNAPAKQPSSMRLQAKMRSQQYISSVNQAFVERAQQPQLDEDTVIPDLPPLSDTADFYVLGKGDWNELTNAIADEDLEILEAQGYAIPFQGLFKRRVLETRKRAFDHAQAQLINNANDDLWGNELEVPGKPLGKPFMLGEGLDDEREARALGHHIVDAFDEHPDIDQIEVYQDPNSHYVQLFGNARPVAMQYLIEVDKGVDLTDPSLQIQNMGTYRTKNVTITSEGELKPLLPVDIDVEGVGAMSLPVQIFRVVAPRVGYRRVVDE